MRVLSWTVLLWHPATIPLVASRKPIFSDYSYPKYEKQTIRGLGKERSFRSYRRLQMEENPEKCSMGMSTCPPSQAPSVSVAPSFAPSPVPSSAPTISQMPTASLVPSSVPTRSPAPSSAPSAQPSFQPSSQPSAAPSSLPSVAPSAEPTTSNPPTGEPSSAPSSAPSSIPTPEPSALPSETPSLIPSFVPSTEPSIAPSSEPSQEPSVSFNPTISSQPSIAPTASAMPSTSAAPSNIPSIQPSMTPTNSPEPSIDPFAFDTTVVAGVDGTSYTSTCRTSIPEKATGVQEQLLTFGYSLYLEAGSNVTFEVNGIELRLQREVTDEFLMCDFSQTLDFYTHEINSLPRDAADTNQTCSGDEMIENATCFKVNAGFAATIFYMPDDGSGRRRLQSDTITDPNVVEAFSTFLESVFRSGELSSPKVVGMTFESFVNTLPPTLAPTLPPGERGSTSSTPGAITGYAVAAAAAVILLIAGLLWYRSRQEKGEGDRNASRVEYAPHQDAEPDFPVEERTNLSLAARSDDLASHLTSQYPISDGDEPADEQGFPRSASKEEPRMAYVFGEDDNSFEETYARVLETSVGTEEVQDPMFVPTGVSPARSHASSKSMYSGETPIDFDPTMIPRDYDVDDTVEL